MATEQISMVLHRFDFESAARCVRMMGQQDSDLERELMLQARDLLTDVAQLWEMFHTSAFRRGSNFIASCDGSGNLSLDLTVISSDIVESLAV